jgi:hypothetical protein
MSPSWMRITRSAMSAMPALWVMHAVSVPSSRLMLLQGLQHETPVAESSAPVGSSHSSTAGRLAMARAMATRCCSPPESCGREVVQALAQAHQGQGLLRPHGRPGDLGHRRHVLAGRQAGDQVVELEHEAHVIAPVGSWLLVGGREVAVQVEHLPRRGRIQPAQDVQQGGFAAAGRPQQHHQFPRAELQVDAAQGVHGNHERTQP